MWQENLKELEMSVCTVDPPYITNPLLANLQYIANEQFIPEQFNIEPFSRFCVVWAGQTGKLVKRAMARQESLHLPVMRQQILQVQIRKVMVLPRI